MIAFILTRHVLRSDAKRKKKCERRIKKPKYIRKGFHIKIKENSNLGYV